ncbi:ArsR/SmtB family transcription factor [Agarivorans aestuarii]|uniref:ArsR/SmtB family transcription factor n=1 Tax=Agarivorans aestuarii TaxID=1563703 RepID=UPI001C7EA21A|nr:metalloregulator ArsR/SmtB family transcription factor [Agarivorans aestuarii]
MNTESIAKALKELGHPTRLSIYRSVVRAGYAGIAVGGLQENLGIPGSTLSHHISGLVSAGLLSQRREGRTLYCVAEFECLQTVIGFLQDECCADEQAPPQINNIKTI